MCTPSTHRCTGTRSRTPMHVHTQHTCAHLAHRSAHMRACTHSTCKYTHAHTFVCVHTCTPGTHRRTHTRCFSAYEDDISSPAGTHFQQNHRQWLSTSRHRAPHPPCPRRPGAGRGRGSAAIGNARPCRRARSPRAGQHRHAAGAAGPGASLARAYLRQRDRSTLPLQVMDLSNTLFHAFCF